ncbi:hypothetical protein EJ110_NYTH14858 [Nymphaea thermarum]|nr:hypothetical protein EJ110_NYTH14858 [Nymphaea thermarum]
METRARASDSPASAGIGCALPPGRALLPSLIPYIEKRSRTRHMLLTADSRARLVAGSFQGYSGHVDGKPSDARFNHPKGLAVDSRGNVYVADTANMAIRRIGESGVTTIAGGRSNVAGYADGPSEDAKFSNDFDLVYDGSSCSLIVVDRGNAALRQILLHDDECSDQHISVVSSDILMIVGAILVGYVTCLFQDGFVPTQLFKMKPKAAPWGTVKREKPVHQNSKDETKEWWPLVTRMSSKFKSILVTAGHIFFYPVPWLKPSMLEKEDGKDHLVMPEDETVPKNVQKQWHSWTAPDTQQVNPATNDFAQQKPSKTKPSGLKDQSTSAKLRSFKRQEIPDFYGATESSQHMLHASKSMKEKSRHRHHDKTREVVFGALGNTSKPMEIKSVDYGDPKFDHYNIRRKFGNDEDHFQF